MRPLLRPILLIAALAPLLSAGACADSSENSVEAKDDASSPSNTVPDTSNDDDASGPADASVDVDADAVEAAARICSDDHFCHSALPPQQSLRSVWGDGSGTIWAVSKEGSVLRWDGSTWNVHATFDGELKSVWGSSPTDVWIAGAPGLLHGVGPTPSSLVFTPVDVPGDPAQVLSSIWGTGPNDVWAVGGILSDFESDGRVLHYGGPAEDGTSGWTLDPLSDLPLAFGNVWGTAEGGAWLQGSAMPFEMGGVYHRAPGGTSWDPVTLPAPPNASFAPDPCAFTAVGSSSASSIWIAGRTGDYTEGFWHGTSADDGSTFDWTFSPLVFGALGLNAVWGLGTNDSWGVGPSGRVTHWNGTKWAQAAIRVTALPVTASFYAIWGTSNDDFWVVGDDIAIHKTTGNAP